VKKQLPLILSLIVGFAAIAVFYIPAKISGDLEDLLVSWAQVLAASALILGGINIVQVNYPKIRRRERDWPYKVVLLASAAIMLLSGIPWHRLFAEEVEGSIAVAGSVDPELAGGDKARLVVASADNAMVSIDGAVAVPANDAAGPVGFELSPGPHAVRVFAGATKFTIGGYEAFTREFEVQAGQVATATVPLQMKWGLEGRVFTWLYDHVFAPCNATMFALLAFFIASAAFRAFRARNVEAALLLGAAILVMLGRVPIGSLLSESFPYISDWLVDVPNNAGRRAIMMGAALGAVATSLRVILGLERSHLGAD